MKHFMKMATVVAVSLALPLAAQAHRAWIVPAATVLSGDDPWVTFDAAISNDIFHADHAAMRLEGIKVTGPDGKAVELQNGATGKYRSTFDLNLSQRGTYKVFSASGGLNARWETEEGERRFWPPRGQTPDAAAFAKEVPAKAKNLEVSQSSRRMETFVTAGSPSETVLKPTNSGLELVPVTHPNDLFAGEKAEFGLIIDGKPAVGAKVTVIPGGMRYRNGQDAIEVETDKDGKFAITWPAAGLYWLSASYRDNQAKAPATSRSGSYVATFEVLPE
ncbi:DUF4198 domain-containing protein [Cellvibrio polysaccharolyticus]|uniref:DUF4198 domain-containing protein n=1 Tax=Cellvibrio polysaccharolyticus TaxID=2082724 RepID=A0A928YW36_9GAMM|nr:DUF4198 domain-containing protein [Cellvibrio polysaccharolyticus]MBE8717778.1 DUF4198 domain-containing protein [Cellvibrio polysaccharolyticus]